MTGKGIAHQHEYLPGWPLWPALGVAMVLLLPLAALAIGDRSSPEQAFTGPPSPAVGVAGRPAFPWTSFAASLAVSAAAASVAVIVGGLVAAALELTDLPARSLWATAMLIAFASPSAVWALAQVYCYGSSGLVDRWLGDTWRPWLTQLDAGHFTSSVLVLGQMYAPLAMLLIGRGLARLPQSGWDAARLLLPPWRRGRWLAGAVRPEAAAAWLLAFALSLGNFSVPHVLQCRLFPIEVYLRLTNYLDRGGASRSALALLSVALFAVAVLAFVERRRQYVTARSETAAQRIELGRRAWLVAAALAGYLAITVVLPVSAMVVECRSLPKFLAAARDAAPETANTLRTALLAAALALLAATVVGRAAARRKSLALDFLSLLPIGVPALVLGLAYSQFYNRDWPVDLKALGNTNALVVLALTARAWPFAARAMASGERRIAGEWRESAWLSGLGRWRRAWWIDLPLLADHALAAVLIGYVLTVGEVEISQLLCAPGQGTLALRLFTFMHFGPVHVAASLALMQLAVALLPVLAYFLLTNRCLEVV
ncbi:MAG TPA: hypothetical protein VNH11_16275 [Pirellulales bacterium]|nr:hypothetical protein [Pirellulales bacterium]